MSTHLPAGYTMRPAEMDDLPACVDLWNACARELVGVEKFELAEARQDWLIPIFHLATDTRLVVAPSGQVVGYYEVWDLYEPHVTVNAWGREHPDYRNLGIEAALLAWAEERARQAIPKAPPEARVAMQIFALSCDAAGQAAYRAAGFTLVRHSLRMVIHLNEPPPEPQWPQGIRVRSMTLGQDERAVIQAVRDSFQDHFGWVETPFEAEFQRWKYYMETDGNFDPSLWFLALEGNEIAGISLCRMKAYDDAEMGWVSTLGVLRPWRRRGVGLALLQHSFGELYKRGRRKIGLGVDAQSLTGATRLYEKAGMRPDPTRQFNMYEKELRPGVDLRTVKVEEPVYSDQLDSDQ